MTTHLNFRSATTTASIPDVVPVGSPRSAARPDPEQKPPRRRWIVPVGLAAAVSAIGIGVMVQRDGAETPQPDPPAVVIESADRGRGPNTDLPRDLTLTAPAADVGPNVDLPRDWTLTAPVTSLGPNADLPPDWTLTALGAVPAAPLGPNADLPSSWVVGPNTAAPQIDAGPNADLPRDMVREAAAN